MLFSCCSIFSEGVSPVANLPVVLSIFTTRRRFSTSVGSVPFIKYSNRVGQVSPSLEGRLEDKIQILRPITPLGIAGQDCLLSTSKLVIISFHIGAAPVTPETTFRSIGVLSLLPTQAATR